MGNDNLIASIRGGELRGQRKHTISNFVAQLYILFCIDDNLLFPTDRNDFSGAIGITRMVDESAAKVINQNKEEQRESKPAYPRFPFLVASTTKSSSIRKR